jgi:hypothetical protein
MAGADGQLGRCGDAPRPRVALRVTAAGAATVRHHRLRARPAGLDWPTEVAEVAEDLDHVLNEAVTNVLAYAYQPIDTAATTTPPFPTQTTAARTDVVQPNVDRE